MRKLRKHQLSNRLIAGLLKALYQFLDQATNRWTPFGKLSVQFDGIKFLAYSEADDYVMGSLFYNKPINEQLEIHTFLQFARISNAILDIGANVGIYSILSAKVNEHASIYAFEPNGVNANRLRKNIELNRLSNVYAVERAVGDKTGDIRFTVPVDAIISDSSSALEDFSKSSYNGMMKWKTISVPQTSIDDFIQSKNLTEINLVKIDVEGYEMMVFQGARQCIQRYRPVIQCEIFVDDVRKKFFDSFMLDYGYTVYTLVEAGLLRLDRGIHEQSGQNFIFIPHSFPELITSVEKAATYLNKN